MNEEKQTLGVVRKVFYALFASLFIIISIIPAFLHVSKLQSTDYIRSVESRFPAALPNLPRNIESVRTFPHNMDEYLNDHFGMRQKLLALHSESLFKAGTSISKDVVIGEDGWLYFKEPVQQYRGMNPFTHDEMEHWTRQFSDYREWLSQKGIHMVLVVVPDKPYIEPDHLPKWIHKGSSTPLAQLTHFIDENNIALDILDLSEPLLHASHTTPPFFKFDTHWNNFGAYVGYTEILKHISLLYPECHSLELGQDIDIQPSSAKRGNLSRRINLPYFVEPNADLMTLSNPAQDESIEVFNGNSFLPASINEASVRKRISHYVNPGSNTPSVMVVRDSFSDLLIPMFRETFSETWAVHHWTMQNYHKDLIEKFKPDILLYEIAASSLNAQLPDFPPAVEMKRGMSKAVYHSADQRLTIDGWVLLPLDIDEIIIESELGIVLGHAKMHQVRPDVSKKFPDYSNIHPGWSLDTVLDRPNKAGRFISAIYKHKGTQIQRDYMPLTIK